MTSIEKDKFNMNIQASETFLSDGKEIDVVGALLEDSWKKKEKMVFFKERNTYILEVNGKNHPMWKIDIFKKSDEFHSLDWKLKKDIKRLKNLGQKKTRKLYLDENNKNEILTLITAMESNNFSLVYSDEYIIFKDRDRINIFKIAANMYLREKEDGLYLGEKRIF